MSRMGRTENLKPLIKVGFLFILFSVLYAPCSVPTASAATINKPSNFLSQNTGLIGWWTFDGKDTPWTSATAATALDKSGNYATGTLTSMNRATAPAQGKIGQGLSFDGVDDYVNIPYANLNFERTDPFSFSVWAKWKSPLANSQGLIGRYIPSNGGRGTTIYIARTTTAYQNANAVVSNIISAGDGGNGIWTSTNVDSFPPNVWTHITVTYDGSSQGSGVKVYRNGDSMSTTVTYENLSATIRPDVDWRIGDDYTNDWTNGVIDDIRPIANRSTDCYGVNIYSPR